MLRALRRKLIPEKWVLDSWHHSLRDIKPGYEKMVQYRQATQHSWRPWVELDDLIGKAERYKTSLRCCEPAGTDTLPRDEGPALSTESPAESNLTGHSLEGVSLLAPAVPRPAPTSASAAGRVTRCGAVSRQCTVVVLYGPKGPEKSLVAEGLGRRRGLSRRRRPARSPSPRSRGLACRRSPRRHGASCCLPQGLAQVGERAASRP
jgi:hypothetical protein